MIAPLTLTEDHYKAIEHAIDHFYFSGDPEDDETALVRLQWYKWWMRWALDNCEWPSVHNG